MLAWPAEAQPSQPLRLVFADPYAVVFMAEGDPARSAPTGPVEVTHWTFFDPADRLTSAWGWNTRVSHERIYCQAGQMTPLRHQTYLDRDPVEEITPPYRMRAPVGADKEAILAHVCNPEAAPAEVVVEDRAAARAWADAAYLAMRTAGR